MKTSNKPRNHVFLAMMRSRKPGAHDSSPKKQRQQQSRQLRRTLKDEGFLLLACA